jgi:glycosyltransferase involved in cell wall biosynthesis
MKIAYLGQMADVSRETSIAKKIRGQCLAWQEAGHSVRYFALTPTLTVWPGLAPVATELLAGSTPVARLLHSPALGRRIRAWQPDVIYFRYAYHSPGLPDLFREIPAVAEINSDDTMEYGLTLGPVKQLYHRLTRARVLRAVAGFVPVTEELARRFAIFSRPASVIANGVDLASFPQLPAAGPTAPRRLAFMGSPGTPWHGLDRIGALAALMPDLLFDIIGCTVDDWRVATAAASPPPANFVFHGHMVRTDYEPLLRNATAALGTFGLYRKGMDEACPLKVREYLALGLPVIGACHDTDIPEGADYYLRLPNADTPLAPHVTTIKTFLDHWSGRRVSRDAIAHLDLQVKEPRRLEFMAQVVAGFHCAAP